MPLTLIDYAERERKTKIWNSETFELQLEDGVISVAKWVKKPEKTKTIPNLCKIKTKFGDRLLQIIEIKYPSPERRNLAPEFIQPKHSAIDFNVPIHILDPDSKDYAKHLQQIATADLLVTDVETFTDSDNKHAGLHPRDGRIRLIQLFDGHTVWIADLKGRDLNSMPLFAHLASERDKQHQRLQGFFEVLGERLRSEDCLIVGHNLHFDLRFLQFQLGLKARNVSCTQLGAQVYFGDYSGDSEVKQGGDPILKGGYGLANLCDRFFDAKLDKTEQKSDWGVPELSKSQVYYAANDVIATYHLHKALISLYQDMHSPLYAVGLLQSWEVENGCLPVTVDIEACGMPFDKKLAEQHIAQINEIRNQLLPEWKKLCPNITYTQDAEFGRFLESEYQVVLSKEVDGKTVMKVDKSNLAPYLHIPIVRLRGELVALDGLLNNLQGFVRSAEKDGRVHTTYRTLTGFGRFSSGESKYFDNLPNLQSVSSKQNPLIKKYNLPNPRSTIKPFSGYTMAVIDLAGAHGRIAADQAEDEAAIAGNNDSSIDNHSKVAVFVAKCKQLDWTWQDIAKLREEKTEIGSRAKAFRDTAKNTYYGWLNGAGAKRVQLQIAANEGYLPELSACEAAIEGCKQLYPAVLKHREALHKRLLRDAVIVDGRPIAINISSDGFRILLPLVKKFNKYKQVEEWEAPYTQSLAALWTRIEATAIKRALLKIQVLIDENPQWELQIIGIVHDEVDLLVKTEFEEIAISTVNNIVGDEFKAQLKRVVDGRATKWQKLKVNSWADK
jgi:DNA polymerase I-like protein with 3'-5' exonuclease and polymerase domains